MADKKKDLRYDVVGAAIEVHNVLGSSFDRETYKRALKIELRKRNMDFKADVDLPIIFKDEEVGRKMVDFIVEDDDEALVLEIRAKEELTKTEKAKALGYLRALPVSKGILLNFGASRLEFVHKPHQKP